MSEFIAGKYRFPLGHRVYVMGILNVTPDSFSDGGKYEDRAAAVNRCFEMCGEGADIIDIGAQSTGPDSRNISPEEELSRLLPVLDELNGRLNVPVSVDTYYTEVAQQALNRGVDIINDVSGTFNRDIAALCMKHGAGYIVMHNDGGAGTVNEYPEGVINAVQKFFDAVTAECGETGFDIERLCLDPGIGFGKSYEDNLRLLRCMDRLDTHGTALLAAASRKRVIGKATGETEPSKRVAGTLAAHTAAILGGADIIRVHDVAPGVQAARMAFALRDTEF
ncbi:MAG: dihydropteroate synthase [Clostridiales bacterium]|nr:dihydropteroate synthase [Clostridiales bacterium]